MEFEWKHVHTGAVTNYFEAPLGGPLGVARYEVNRAVPMDLKVEVLNVTRRVREIALNTTAEKEATRVVVELLLEAAEVRSARMERLASECASISRALLDIGRRR